MIKFILKLASFIFLLAFGSILLDYAISSGLAKTEEYRFQTWEDIIQSRINADIIIMGNSRAFSHFSPKIIDSVLHVNSYNLGIGGHPFNVQYLRYRLYEKHNLKPILIIQNIDFATLAPPAGIGHEREQILPFVFDDFLNDELIKYGFTSLELKLPLYRYYGYQMVIKNGLLEFSSLKHYHNQPSHKGYRPEQGEWDGSELAKLDKIEAQMDTTSVRLLGEFLEYCQTENIKVVMVCSPLYFEARQKIINREQYDTLLKNISASFKCPYLDYSEDPICQDTSFFHVAVHLNQKGAELFSLKLAQDIETLGLYRTNSP